MQGANKELWKQLCEQAANEKDPSKMLELTKEIGRLLAQKQKRLDIEAAEESNPAAKAANPGSGARSE